MNACNCCPPPGELPVLGQSPASPDICSQQVRLDIEDMDCPAEELQLRKALQALPWIRHLEFSLLERRLQITYHAPGDLSQILQQIASTGLQARPLLASQQSCLQISQLCCAVEESQIRNRLSSLPGLEDLQINLLQRTLTFRHTPEALETALASLQAMGFTPQPVQTDSPPAPLATGLPPWQLAVAGVAALLAEGLHLVQNTPDWLVALPALVAICLSGLTVYRKGWLALKNRDLNINALMSVAVTGALLIGQWPEAAMVMVLFALAERLEARAMDRARDALRGLLELAPQQALVLQPDGQWRRVAAAAVPVGSRVRVRPGERIALDGQVLQGQSSGNQAPITGESLPVEKSPGDPLFAGTINQAGELEYQTRSTASDSTLARIIQTVEQAQSARAPTQRFVDRFARLYTPAILGLALAVALLPPLFGSLPVQQWIYRALVLLVVACPCALVIATPVTLVSGLAAAARRGILVKGGSGLETASRITDLALDKTGTLTRGQPTLTDQQAIGPDAMSQYQSLAARLAARSDHPVSRAILGALGDTPAAGPVSQVTALPGRGIRGYIDGHCYHLGNHPLIEDLGLCSPALEKQLAPLEAAGKTVNLLCDEHRVLALFAVADTLKPGSHQAIAELHQLGIQTLMLSGDNLQTARLIGQQAGITEVYGDLLPAGKLAAVEQRLGAGRTVAMAGDGINDAPALARADLGFAMGAAGSDTAIETADIAIMDDDLRKIPLFIRLARRTMAVLKANIWLAVGIKTLFLATAITGYATLWMAVFADMGVSLLVVFNGLRLLRA